ncbi:MAG: histidine phosphatase family protein [Cetobacterium sp.]|uniref:histidine phosphatase family protein n=1 Tax=Cetobacterium sp. TaxID=2071632 RepID=UPI003F3CE3D8
MKLIFVRHGEPRQEDYNLTEMGKKQCHCLGKYLIEEEKNIKKVYMGTFGRSVYTGEILNEYLKVNFENKEWLNEFKHLIKIDEEKESFPWELEPELWINDREALSSQEVFTHGIYGTYDLEKKCKNVWENFDEILKNYGYERENNLYRVKEGNEDTVVIVSHFATISVIMAHLLNVPLYVVLHMFWIAPSGYVKLITEEISKGKAIFRSCEYGGMGHLTKELKSYYGLQKERK